MSKLEGESTSGKKESVGEENAADGQEAEATALLNLEKTTENVIYDPISSLKIGDVNWTIRARCTRKSKITPYEPQKGKPGRMMTFDFQESSGLKIKGIAFNDAINPFDHQVAVGKVYAITKAKVQKGYGKTKAGYHSCELVFYNHSQFELLEDEDDYVPPVESFHSLSEVDSGKFEIDSSINVLGVMSAVGSMQNLEMKQDDGTVRDANFLEVQLVDSTLKQVEVPVTFWGPAAKDIRRYSCGSAIQLKGAVVISREGRFALKATAITDIEVDPKTHEAEELIRWFSGGNKRRNNN